MALDPTKGRFDARSQRVELGSAAVPRPRLSGAEHIEGGSVVAAVVRDVRYESERGEFAPT